MSRDIVDTSSSRLVGPGSSVSIHGSSPGRRAFFVDARMSRCFSSSGAKPRHEVQRRRVRRRSPGGSHLRRADSTVFDIRAFVRNRGHAAIDDRKGAGPLELNAVFVPG